MSDLITDGLPQASEVNVRDTFDAIGLRRSIRWYEPNEIMTVDNFLEWIDPREDKKSIQFCYVEEEEDA